jgi:pimeloyl-ACP methyl ester carboxylesterase
MAAHRKLSSFLSIPQSQVGFVGHSEGGLTALMAASSVEGLLQIDIPLVLVSVPGRPFGTVLHDQVGRILSIQNAPKHDRDRLLESVKATVSKIRQTRKVPDDIPASLQSLFPFYAGEFLADLFDLDIGKAAQKYRGPVLLIYGEDDRQIDVSKESSGLMDQFSCRPAGTTHLFRLPSTDHNIEPLANSQRSLSLIRRQFSTVLISWLHAVGYAR